MADLEKGKDGKYYWNYKIGGKYYLGWQNGRVSGMGMMDQKEVRARYFGVRNGKHLFFEERGGKVFQYSSPVGCPASWFFDCGDDEPSFPGVRASFDREFPNGLEKEFLLSRLRAHKEKDNKKKQVI